MLLVGKADVKEGRSDQHSEASRLISSALRLTKCPGSPDVYSSDRYSGPSSDVQIQLPVCSIIRCTHYSITFCLPTETMSFLSARGRNVEPIGTGVVKI